MKNEKNINLLERLKINSIEIDLIKNGTPLELSKKTSKKVDLEELKKFATQLLPNIKEEKEEVIIRDKNEFEEIRDECFDEETKKYSIILSGSRQQ